MEEIGYRGKIKKREGGIKRKTARKRGREVDEQ